jgi:hypothetical protein
VRCTQNSFGEIPLLKYFVTWEKSGLDVENLSANFFTKIATHLAFWFAQKCNRNFRNASVTCHKFYDMGPTTSLPLRMKSCYRFLLPLKIRHPWPGLNMWILDPMASMLPLDHRGQQLQDTYTCNINCFRSVGILLQYTAYSSKILKWFTLLWKIWVLCTINWMGLLFEFWWNKLLIILW